MEVIAFSEKPQHGDLTTMPRGSEAAVSIRTDGSLDLSVTMLGAVAGIDTLRHPGDEISQEGERIRVLFAAARSDYSTMTLQSSRAGSDRVSTELYQYTLLGRDDGTAWFQKIRISATPGQTTIVAGILRRGDDPSRLATEAMRNYPRPPAEIDAQVVEELITVRDGLVCVLLKPKKGLRTNALVVALPSAFSKEGVTATIEQWKYRVVEFGIAVVIPRLEREDSDTLLIAWPAAAALSLAGDVRDSVKCAVQVIKPQTTYLTGEYLGAYLAKYIWHTNNQLFDAFLLDQPRYEADLPATGEPGPNVDKKKAIYAFYYVPESGAIEPSKRSIARYRKEGFQHIFECITTEHRVETQRSMKVAALLGRPFPNLTIREAQP